MSTRSRRLKWYPSPSPKIINLPRRHHTRRKKTRATVNTQPIPATAALGTIGTYNYKGKLESLFGEEREFARAPVVVSRRERVEAVEDGGAGQLTEEKLRFQAEILRAECNFLRMERKFALKKLESNRVRIEMALKSALQNLDSGRKKLYEGKNMEMVMEEEMKELAEKLEELHSIYNGNEDHELRKCKNFDKKASRLQRRLEKLGGLEIKIEGDRSNLDHKSRIESTDVEVLKRKMERLSNGVFDRMEKEYGSILSSSSVASSASTSKRVDFPDHHSLSNRFSDNSKESSMSKCSGRCKLLVRRIVEQVGAETEQWSQMQEMLGQLRQEMEELQTSKDFWETQALSSSNEIQSLKSYVEEWRGKAVENEAKANKLQTEVTSAMSELEKLKEVGSTPKKTMLSLGKQLEKGTKNGSSVRTKGQSDKDAQPLSLGKQLAREKRILICRLKENRQSNNEGRKGCNLVRSPFKDIGNSSYSNAIFPLHCPESRVFEE